MWLITASTMMPTPAVPQRVTMSANSAPVPDRLRATL
jgi:hypothetical protein